MKKEGKIRIEWNCRIVKDSHKARDKGMSWKKMKRKFPLGMTSTLSNSIHLSAFRLDYNEEKINVMKRK